MTKIKSITDKLGLNIDEIMDQMQFVCEGRAEWLDKLQQLEL